MSDRLFIVCGALMAGLAIVAAMLFTVGSMALENGKTVQVKYDNVQEIQDEIGDME